MPSAPLLSAPPALSSLIENAALFLDFDGTLVELAPRPDAIVPIEGLADRLAKLADRLEGRLALVSGRAIDDIETHLGPIKVAIAGSHGSDMRSASGEILGEGAKKLPTAIEAALRTFADEYSVDYEDKAHGGALHYRSNPAMGEHCVAFAKGLAAQHGWRAQGGKCVIEIVADGGDKGTAVETFMNLPSFEGTRPIFVGDDLTDEAGFAACNAFGGVGILVGEREGTLAQYCLPTVSSVHNWLEI